MLLSAALTVAALVNPCADPARTVVCPDLTMRQPYGMRLIVTGRRRVLAATNAIVNTGDGPLEVRARRRNIGEDQMTARQVLRPRTPGGAAQLLPATGTVDFFDTRTRGRYWKYQAAASFTLRGIGPGGTLGRIRRTGPKVDYCFRDLRRVNRLDTATPYAHSPRGRIFGACSTTAGALGLTLGTSVGWADIYPWDYPQNAIDVTGLAGCFLYTLKADPRDELRELREDNNSGSRVVRLPWTGASTRGCLEPDRRPG